MTLILPKSLVAGYSPFRVPTVPVEIDWSHPLSAGLFAAFIPYISSTDYAGTLGNLQINSQTQQLISGYGGNMFTSAAPGGYSVAVNTATNVTYGSVFSLISHYSTSGNNCCAIGYTDVNNMQSGGLCLAIGSNGNRSYQLGGASGQFVGILTSWNVGDTNAVCGTISTSNVGTLYKNGCVIGSNAVTPASASPYFNVNSDGVGGVRYANIGVHVGLMWKNRTLTASEAQWISAEPFCLFKPIKSRLYHHIITPTQITKVATTVGFDTLDPSTGNIFDIGSRYVTKSYLLDAYPNLVTSANRFSPGLSIWGFNGAGQLGNGNILNYSSPIQVGGLYNWKQVSCGYSTLAVKTDGTLWACGLNLSGQLGIGNQVNYNSPVQVGGLTNWKQVSCGYNFTTAIKTDGTLWTWGQNVYGQLGLGNVINYSSPVQVGSLTNWKQVACGYRISAAVKTDGSLWTWGINPDGQLGNGVNISYSSPIQVGGLYNWKQVSCGYSTLAVKTDGTLWACGLNLSGQLGIGNQVNYNSPVQVGGLTNWKQVSCGYNFTTAIKTDGTLWTWGQNVYGQLGLGNVINYSSPVQVGSLTNWKQVSFGPGSSNLGVCAAVKTDGTLWAWGYNSNGQLGNGSVTSYSSPIQIGSLANWKNVSVGYNTISAIQDGYI
jgi:alpha-tubulin suppressor-like RCC1 family protein